MSRNESENFLWKHQTQYEPSFARVAHIKDMSFQFYMKRIGGEMVSVLASSAVDRGFEARTGHSKDYKIGICCKSVKHAAFRSESKDWLARNRDSVSE